MIMHLLTYFIHDTKKKSCDVNGINVLLRGLKTFLEKCVASRMLKKTSLTYLDCPA